MSKTIKTVFVLIGVLVLCLVVWAVFFGNTLGTAWNAVAGAINTAWNAVVGGDEDIAGEWDSPGGNANVGEQASNAAGATVI